ncbi:hypothetical protein [Paenibacillus sp. FSL H7-0331]|uniref:CdiA C-terminal domain-containing protein n=1 Tax=Paenibacillus sp. FSL H7-0331 TaxID=1920421 RepID=UPI00273E90DD|nr:hypothetical protein [Paenibacillus sp. FSL H7-0331]
MIRNIRTKTKTQAERIVLNLDNFAPEKVTEIVEGILRKANPNGDLKNLKELFFCEVWKNYEGVWGIEMHGLRIVFTI